MLWSHLFYVALFSSNIYVLVIYLLYATQIVNNICMVFVVPEIRFFQKSNNICFLQHALTHVIAWHGIQLDSVQWDHRSSVVGYHDHVSTASSQRDSVSQSTLSHGNLANRCGRWSWYYCSPPSERRHVRGNFLLTNIPWSFMSDNTCRLFPFCYPATEVGKDRRGCLLKPDMSAGDNANCCSGRLSISNCKATRPRYFFGSQKTSLVESDYVIQEKHISDSSQIFLGCCCWRTRWFMTAHLFWSIFQVHVCCYAKPFGMPFVKDVLLLHECHRSVNILVFRDPLPPILILMFCS